ncbi:MAG TPA: DUF5818 domain-containing protein [Terriglobales bacterium]|nr:DUF5818 domain-containing protein [Terriglobales bacterium]
MRNSWLIFLLLLLSAVWVAAQTPASSPQNGNGSASDSSGGHGTSSSQSRVGHQATVQGCLSGSSGNYTLVGNNGMTYQLQGDSSQLNQHVGQEVKVDASESANAASTRSATTSGTQTLQVSKVEKVSQTCITGNTSNPSSR